MGWFIVWCLTLFSTLLLLYHRGQCTYPGLLWDFFYQTSVHYSFQATGAFPQQWGMMQFCHNDLFYPQKQTGWAGKQDGDLILQSCSLPTENLCWAKKKKTFPPYKLILTHWRKKEHSGKHCGKRWNCSNEQFHLFSTMFAMESVS